uniref:Myosin motor domain-containing protein n=1 Tax=Angiostrongylus costaricensis TaxID=334426 RepID=A0A0R3PLV3_ANGCS
MNTDVPSTGDELKILKANGTEMSRVKNVDAHGKALLWVPHEKDGFALSFIINEPDNEGYVEVEFLESHERQRVSRDDYQKVNPPRFDKCEDMSSMSCLNEASVLHNLRQRYFSNLIYTYSGLFCVVVNPYKRLPIYTDSIAELYKGRKRKEMPPHIFAGRLEEQLLQANPILEAFGNSKTIKNDNSSRFGKFIRIHFDGAGCISGANIEFYLLEKSRILRQSAMERCFHIFYQIIKGASTEQRAALLLESCPEKYHFLSNGDVSIAGVDDAVEYKETLRAMNIIGFKDDEIQSILRIVSAVMLFGNLNFSHEGKNSDQAVLVNDSVAQKICTLMGLHLSEVMRAFLKPKIKVGREYVHRSQNEEQARFSVGAITKATYERLFRWLVQRLNKSLDRTREHAVSFLGILDIAGFEIFEMNSFEQLCINYTNEKLQQLFNNTMFEKEQQEYLNEGLEWDMIDFGLNLKPTIDLIEKPMGILSTLDDVCLFPQGNDVGFVERLASQHHSHPKYLIPEMRSKSDFALVHYAGRVDYKATGWRVKNMDPLNENVVELLQLSKDPLVAEIWKDVSETATVFGSRVKKGMFRTVSQMYKDQLSRLMTTLNNTYPHFVRCIIPNHEKRHGSLNAHLVLDQLRCNGVLEGIRICRQGFPNRITFQEFRQRYEKLLAPCAIPEGFMDGKEAVRFVLHYRLLSLTKLMMDSRNSTSLHYLYSRILEAMEVQPSLYRIGQSKVFFRTGVIAGLEEDRDDKLAILVGGFQAFCRGFLARLDFTRRRERTAAIRIIQRNGLACIRLRGWPWWKLFTKVKPLLEITNKDMVIAEKEQQLRSTSERLRRSEIFINDMSREIEKFGEERNRLQEKLDIESMERAEADEARQRIAARNIELESALEQLEKQLRLEEQRHEEADRIRRKLMEDAHEIELRLEQEERARQILQLEKVEVEKKLRDIEIRSVDSEEFAGRLAKEKRVLEERVKDLSSRLIDEEEKSKSLLKQKNKAEISLCDMQQQLEREKLTRSECEVAKRVVDAELREARESTANLLQKIEELSQIISRKDSELTGVKLSSLPHSFLRCDEEASARQQLEKVVREIQTRLDETLEDLKQEHSLRMKAEKARRDLSEEVESYKSQLTESIREADERCEALRIKYQRQIEELVEEVNLLKKCKTVSDKTIAQLETELATCKTDLTNMQALQNESERRRKVAENQLADQTLRSQQYCEEKEQLLARVTKLTSELETVLEGRESEMRTHGDLLKKIAVLDLQISEMTEASEEANITRSNLTAKLRKAEDNLAESLETQFELKQAVEKSEKEAASLRSQLADSRKRLDEAVTESVEEAKRLHGRELAAAIDRAEEAEVARDKAQHAKLKAQQECRSSRSLCSIKTCHSYVLAEDACREVSEITSSLRECERRQRKFDQQLADEKALTNRATSERDVAQQQARDAETRFLNAVKELKELREQNEALEKERRFLRLEVDNLVHFAEFPIASTKDDEGKNVFELEKMKKRLEEELSQAKEQIIELEDALQMADDAKSRAEVMLQGARQDCARQLAQREQDEEDKKRSMANRLRELEEELGAEHRLKSQAVAMRKKLDTQIQSLQEEVEHLSKQNEELNRQIRRAQQNTKEAETEGAEARASMDEAVCRARDVEKRLRVAETDISRLSEDLSSCQAARRKIEAERNDLVEELASIRKGVLGQEEKNRYERRITDLQEMLDEEQASNELANDKLRKAQAQVVLQYFHNSGSTSVCQFVEQLTSELTMERSLCERADAEKITLERTIRELKAQVEEVESVSVILLLFIEHPVLSKKVSTANRLRTQLTTAEAKSQKLEQLLQVEEQEKARFCRQVRRLEARLMETNAQLEEDRRQMDQHRQLVGSKDLPKQHFPRILLSNILILILESERSNARYKAEQRRVVELEEEIAASKSKYRELSRQLMDANEVNDSLTRDMNALRVSNSSFLKFLSQ